MGHELTWQKGNLVEVPVHGILVIDHSRDEAESEAAAASCLRVSVAVLRVLPQEARVLLVEAHRLLYHQRLTYDQPPGPLYLPQQRPPKIECLA